MKLARYHTGRDKFIAFAGSFHGRTMGALSLTGSKVVQRKGFGPLVPGVYHAQFPDPYRRPEGVTAEDHAVSCVRFIEDELFRTIVPAEEVAAIVVEPIQGEGGYLVPPQAFLEELRRLADRHGILLIFDEVQCGMGRTGKMWAAEHFGVAAGYLYDGEGHRERAAVERDDCAGRDYELGPGCACLYLWRESGGGGRGACDDRAARKRIDRERGPGRRSYSRAVGVLAASVSGMLAMSAAWG